MTDYWRARKAAEREEKIMKEFYLFMICILKNKKSVRTMEKESNRIIESMFETMKVK